MQPLDNFKFNLQNLIDNYEFKREDRQEMSKRFKEKGFQAGLPNQVLGGSFPIDGLDENELLMFSMVFYDLTKEEKINPKEFFYEKRIKELENLQYIGQEIPSSFEIYVTKNPKKDEYTGYIDLYTLADLYATKRLSYNFQTQRQARYKRNAVGDLMISPSLNNHAVKEMSDLMFENKFESNSIVFNVRQIENKTPQVSFEELAKLPTGEAFGKLTITINYDENSEYETYMDCIDGWHRTNAAIWAVRKARREEKLLTDQLIVVIKQLTPPEARGFIAREFKQNKLNEEYRKALEDEDKLNSIIDSINNYGTSDTNILKNKIGETLKEVEFLNKYTTVEYMREGLSLSSFQFDNLFVTKQNIKLIVDVISEILGYIVYKKFDNDLKLAEKSIYFNSKMFVGYIALAEYLQNKKESQGELISIIMDELNIDEKQLGLNNQQIHAKKIYNYFKDFASKINEVIV